MTHRILLRVAVFALAAVAVAGTGFAQPDPKGKLPADKAKSGKPAEPNAAADALKDELDLLQAQTKLKEKAVSAAEDKLKAEEMQLRRLQAAGEGISASDISKQKAAVAAARLDSESRTAELTEHEVRVRVTKRKLESALANPPKASGPTATEESLAKLVQLMAERNATEKDWMAKEASRLADEAKRQKSLNDEERAQREKQASAAERQAKEAEERMRTEMKLRSDAEAERVRNEKIAVLKRLPNEMRDAELRIRAAELKREQVKLELEAAERDIDRAKAARIHLDEMKAALEKELKPKTDK